MEELIKSVKSLISDIEAMRIGQTEIFGEFEHYQVNYKGDEAASIEWPNLAISLDNTKEILTKMEQGPVIEGSLTPKMVKYVKSATSAWPEPGDKMRFLDANGYEHERADARKFFTKDQILTVKGVSVGHQHHSIIFEEHVLRAFNGKMFYWLGKPV